MDGRAGLTKRSGFGVETATARALVGLGYAALYLLVLTGARLWSVPALYVVALIVLVKVAADDFNYIARETPNRIAGLLVALSLGRVAMLMACDVFWPRVIGLSFDLPWALSVLCAAALVTGSSALVVAEQRVESHWEVAPAPGVSENVAYASLPGIARWRIAAGLALGRTSFEIESGGVSYAIEADDLASGRDTVVRRVLLLVSVLVITGAAFLYSMLRPVIGIAVLLGGCVIVFGALVLWVRAFRGKVALAYESIRVTRL